MHLTHCTINKPKDKYKIYRKIRKVSLCYRIWFSWLLGPNVAFAQTVQKCSRQLNIKMLMCHIQ